MRQPICPAQLLPRLRLERMRFTPGVAARAHAHSLPRLPMVLAVVLALLKMLWLLRLVNRLS